MKTLNFRKVLIPSFALLIGGSLAATLSSTLAWFQYATRAQVAYVGALTHSTKLLKISIDNGGQWGNDYYQNDMASHITGNKLVPITTGAQQKNAALSNFYAHPDLGRGAYTNWLPASSDNYAQFTILAKVTDVDGAANPTALVNDVYITELLIQDDSTNDTTNDLSDAVRVHLAVTDASGAKKYFLFAKSVTSTTVGGYLDLNNDGNYDKDLDNDSWGTQDCYYGEDAAQTSYKYNDTTIISADPDNPTGVSIGQTGTNNMTIVVTTWIEGWSKLDQGLTGNANGTTDTQVWDPAAYVGKKFNVGIRLGVKSHNSDHQN